jgi:threonine dehydrogenase-like Zn-dependent dehydrogenase
MRNVSFKGHNLTVLALKNDEYVGKEVLYSGKPFAPNTLAYMMDYIRPGSTVVDAGWYVRGASKFWMSV